VWDLKSKILIVEDESIEAMNFEQSLKSFGYDVVGIASTGKDAIKMADEFKPDLILMDIVLKGDMDGIEAATNIKEDFDIPVVYLTAHPEESAVSRAKLTTPYGYLIKPVSKTDLKNTIEIALYKGEIESKLKKSEDKHRKLVDNSMVGVYKTNLNGDILFTNDAMAKMFDYDNVEELKENNIKNLYKNPDDRLKFIHKLENEGKFTDYEIETLDKNGQTINVVVSASLENEEISGMFINITDRRKAEASLQEREEFLSGTLNDMTTFVAILKLDGEIIFVNNTPLKLIDKNLEDVKGMMFYDIGWWTFSEETINKLKQNIKLCASGETVEYETQIQTPQGLTWIDYNMHPIYDEKKKVKYLVAEGRDITIRKKAENEIKQAKGDWERTFDAVPDLIAIIDKNYQIIRANKAMTNKLGVHPDDAVGLTCYQAVHGLNDPPNTCPLTKLLEDGCEHSIEIHEDKLNGDYLVSVSPLHDPDGEIIGGVHVARDITQRKKAEEKIKESEHRYRMIGQLISDFAYSCVHGKCGSYEVDWITDSFYHLTGFTEKELNLQRCWLFTVHPEDEQIAYSQLADLEAGSKNVRDFRIISNNGQIRWLRNHVECVEDKLGNLRIYGAAEDITKLKNAVKELEQSEEKYRTLFETDPDYTLLLGSDGIILDVNNATTHITGLSREELIGKHFIELEMAIPEDIPTYVENISRLSKGEEIKPFESQFRDKNGQLHWGFITLNPIIKDKKISSFLAIISDFSERKIAENKLKTTLQEKETLLKEIHHRVKNNLQIISSLLDLQEIYVKEDPTAVKVLEESKNRVISMAIIHEMLYQSKDLNYINFSDYIRNMVTNLFDSYGAKNTLLEINVEEIYLNIETSVPLGLIISELVSNSLKYAFPEKKGTISIELQPKNKKYELIISDNGVGIPEEIDFNTESTLGLRLVKSLVNQLDGTIELDKSHGTKYTIKFQELQYKKRM
jgi:PAS domain S-box-containing protein